MSTFRFTTLAFLLIAMLCIGCQWIPPDNANAKPSPGRIMLSEIEGATFYAEPGLDDALWLEVERANESGTVGGYLTNNGAPRRTLILFIGGASTFEQDGTVAKARAYHSDFAHRFLLYIQILLL